MGQEASANRVGSSAGRTVSGLSATDSSPRGLHKIAAI